MRIAFSAALAVFVVMVFAGVASAYVGPGPGITLIGSMFAVIAAVLLAIFSILFWPVRAFMRKMKKEKKSSENVTIVEPDSGSDSASGPDV
ncbi:MAG: hypothetical protein KAR83_03340 [Thermodesulfovibrionales bacterium]|nr:hypothetical protein [Thermodesulfovibrionales bacterium]